MACYHPVEAWQLESGRVIFAERGAVRRALKLRCGQCIGCRKDRSEEWAARILHESRMHRDSWFATLTYDDDHIPHHNALCYRDFQSFMRALRLRRGKVRFYVAGEYGERTARPHYHACLFGLELPDLKHYRKSPSGHTLFKSAFLDGVWAKGLCSVGALTFQSAAYTAAYINKKIWGHRAQEHYRRVDESTGEIYYLPPEFARMSLRPGIGATWFKKYGTTDALPRDYLYVDGRKTRVPRYYSDLFKIADPFGYDALELERIGKSDRTAEDRTPERLAVREVCATARSKLIARKL